MRLLRTTQVADRIEIQLSNSNQGLTVFAPPDNAFSTLQAGTLNSLTDQEKAELVQFHTIPSFLSTSSFQTVSNPVTTQAGNSQPGGQGASSFEDFCSSVTGGGTSTAEKEEVSGG
ncbi:hypothetical protein F0562_021798 [Nyssa sinensis]|uniref:FAS1 domain-containing protein n=1 Tax=Nyssa sinensis TaxID=561372 RepID=A0A5J5BLM5_9ASTE|nr:hypothetical protein F0562_021798 [Nyssa sinensis]